MKDISTILKNGDLTAKERALIYINAEIERDKTGQEILTANDIKAIKNPKAFTSNSYIDAYNKYLITWRSIVILWADTQAYYGKAKLAYQGLLTSGTYIFKIYVLSEKLEEFLINIASLDKDIKEKADVYFELSQLFIDDIKPFTKVKKKKISTITPTDFSKKTISVHKDSFSMLYEALLAHQNILKKLSKMLGTDVSYKVDGYLKDLKENAETYNELVENILINFETKIGEKNEWVKDKAFKNNDDIFLNLSNLKPQKDVYTEIMEVFESQLGRDFWKDME